MIKTLRRIGKMVLIAVGLFAAPIIVSAVVQSLNGLTANSQSFATSTDTNVVLTIGSSGTIHTFSPSWSGVLSVGRGGTGASSFATGSIPFSFGGIFSENNSSFFWDNVNSLLTVQNLKVSSTTTLLIPLSPTSGGTGQSSYAKGDVLVAQSSSTLAKVGVGADGTVLTASSSASSGVSWESTPQPAASKFGGDGSNGALSISSGTTTIDIGGAREYIRNYTSISITGTGALEFTNPHAQGSIIVLKSQGAVTITSTATAAISVVGMGAPGGAAVSSASPLLGGNNGSDGRSNLFRTNFGGRGLPTAGGTGGASSTASHQFLSLVMQKYPFAVPGAGGGSGAVGNGGGFGTGTSGVGGRGGGALIVECAGDLNFPAAATISVAGVAGGNGTTDGLMPAGGGGGGGSGSVFVLYNTATSTAGTFNVSGGVGGNRSGGTLATNYGGGGGGSGPNAGSNGTGSDVAGAKTGGDGAAGFSFITQNTEY